jgi:hypothetical protein
MKKVENEKNEGEREQRRERIKCRAREGKRER